MLAIQDFFPQLATPKKIFITTHYKPDGDAIGSLLGLYHYLIKLGHTVYPVSPSDVPDFLQYLPGIDKVYNYEVESNTVNELLANADLIFCLDLNDPGRTKNMAQLITDAPQTKVIIDHHLFPSPVWNYGMSEPDKSSTCEMVYDFINLHGGNALINTAIAQCLYTGVLTDTGSFRFPATTASVHRMIADLKDKGLEHASIHEHINDSWSENRMRFMGYVLQQKMEIFPGQHAGLVCISKEDIYKFQLQPGDTEGIVNLPLSISGIRFATFIIERKDEVKLSFRSKGNFDVNEFARKYFNGGGHFNAAGGSSKESFLQTINRFKQILSEIYP